MTYRTTCNQTRQNGRGTVSSVTLEMQENGDAEAQNSPYNAQYESGAEIVFKSNEHQPCSLTDPNPDPDSPPVWLRDIDDMVFTQNVAITPVDLSFAYGVEPITYALTTTPAGLSLSTAGVLSGTPTSVGGAQPICNATNLNGTAGSNAFSITVVPA